MTEIFHWFAARLLFEARVTGSDDSEPLFEERILLVRSDDGIETAWMKARKHGEAAGEDYENESGATVSWRFNDILVLVQLNEGTLGDGMEVYIITSLPKRRRKSGRC